MSQHIGKVLAFGCLVALSAAGVVVASGDPNVAPGDRVSQAIEGDCRAIPGRLDAGASFRGTPVSRGRLCEPPQADAMRATPGAPPPALPVNADVAAYGQCETPTDGAGCMPPIQVQTWSACERNYALYEQMPGPDGEAIPHERTTIRGVDAARFDEGRRIELYGRDVTVVVFAPDAATALQVAKSLRGSAGGRVIRGSDNLPRGTPSSC